LSRDVAALRLVSMVVLESVDDLGEDAMWLSDAMAVGRASSLMRWVRSSEICLNADLSFLKSDESMIWQSSMSERLW
jgi:hypothetical protein